MYYEDGIIKGRSEVERRQKYIVKLIAKLTNDHVVIKRYFSVCITRHKTGTNSTLLHEGRQRRIKSSIL
jgi:hypothetical protein